MNKKLFFLLFILMAVLVSLCICTCTCLAEETAGIVLIDEIIADKSGWTGQEELSFSKDSVTHTFEKNYVYTNGNYKFLNEILSFNIEALTMEDGTRADPYLLLRASETSTVPWRGNNAYLFVLSEAQIELHRWIDSGSEYLAVTENPMKKEGASFIQCGAVNVEDGVQLILFVDGKLALSYLDKTPGLLRNQEGYFGFYNHAKQRILAVGETGARISPVASAFSIEGSGILGEKIKVSYKFMDFLGAEEKSSQIRWHRADRDFAGDSVTTKNVVPVDGIISPIEGAVSDTYIPTEKDIGKYIVASVEPSSDSGTTSPYYSNAIYIDPVKVALNNNIGMIAGEQMAYIFGNCKQIDAADPYIVPEQIDSVSFVPLRFVVEAMGGSIDWNSENGEITFSVNGNTCSLKTGEKSIRFKDTEYVLDAPCYILYDRTMFPARNLEAICGKNVYASNNGVILIGDYEHTLDFDSDTELYDTIFKTIRRASYAQ